MKGGMRIKQIIPAPAGLVTSQDSKNPGQPIDCLLRSTVFAFNETEVWGMAFQDIEGSMLLDVTCCFEWNCSQTVA